MTLRTRVDRETLQLSRPFTIARGTTTERDVVILTIRDGDGHVGYGCAAPSRYYGEHAGTVEAVLPELCALLESKTVEELALVALARACREAVPRNPAARAAVSIAVHDLLASRVDRPVYADLGFPSQIPFESSFTIGIDEPSVMAERAEAAVERGHGTLKLKLGGDDDEAVLEAVREAAPAADIRVDANAAWTPKEALDRIAHCEAYGVSFVEQPVPATDREGLATVTEQSPLPIAADESCVTLSDIPLVADRCDIINIKLMKCGGLREAIRMVHTARAHHLDVMLGCMVESAISIAAAAHLCPIVDYADLDGSLLLEDDPFTGSPVSSGDISLATDPGLGVRPQD